MIAERFLAMAQFPRSLSNKASTVLGNVGLSSIFLFGQGVMREKCFVRWQCSVTSMDVAQGEIQDTISKIDCAPDYAGES